MNDNIINESILYPEKLREFEHNIGANNVSNSLHNMYHIQLEDKDGNVEEYFGKNVMTNYFFRERLCGYSDNTSRDFQIYVGNGVDQDHQPNVENKSMFNVLTTSWKSIDRTRDYYPLTYHSETGYVTQDIKACKIQYDYNLSGVTENVELNEIGCGSSATNLYSHSKIYDINGNEKTIIKRPNQTLTITLYWRISVHESFYTKLWNDGIYGTIKPDDFLNLYAYMNGNKRRLVVTLCKPSSTLAGNFQNGYNSGYFLDYDLTMFYNGNNSSIIQNDDGSRTWTTSTVSDSYSYKKYLMEKNKFDFFSSIFFSDKTNNYQPYLTACNYSYMQLFKEYRMPEAETIETLVKTSLYYKTDFLDIIGRYTRIVLGGSSYSAEKYLWGYLPVVDMDIQSIKRYNFQTGEFDIDETFNNPKNNNYDFCGFVKVGYCWVEKGDGSGNGIGAYICSNQDNQNRAVVGFKSTGATCWATDTWWDRSSWQLVANTAQIEPALQHKKFWIFNKAIDYLTSNGDLNPTDANSPRWWPCPEFEYPDGVHEVTPSFERYADEVSALYYYGSATDTSIKYADETNGFYVQNNVVIRKPESNFSFCPIDNIYEKREALFQPLTTPYVMTRPSLGNQVFINGKVIYFIRSWYDSRSSWSQSTTGVHMVITDLSLPDNEIADSVKYVNVNSTYTHTLTSIENYRFAVVGKYLVINGNGEILIFDTDTDESWLCPYGYYTIRKICGTTSIVITPDTGDTVWRIYDCATKQVTREFGLPEGYSYDTSKGFFAFEDWIYIRCIYGTNAVMFMYTISTQEFKQIVYPSTMDSNDYYGFILNNMTVGDGVAPVSYNGAGYTTSYRGFNSTIENMNIQYKDGICVLRSTNPNGNRTVLIISRYDSENLMIQRYYDNSTNTSDDSIQLAKIYENYYLGFTFRTYYSSGYYQCTRFMDVGRIVKTGSTYSTSDDVEYKCYARDGIIDNNRDEISSIATIYKNKIYYYGNNFSGCNVMVCPPEGIMTHKINFKTKTCQRWNNPKLITIPSFDITLTNIIDQT